MALKFAGLTAGTCKNSCCRFPFRVATGGNSGNTGISVKETNVAGATRKLKSGNTGNPLPAYVISTLLPMLPI